MTVIELKENGAIRTKMLSCDSPLSAPPRTPYILILWDFSQSVTLQICNVRVYCVGVKSHVKIFSE